MKILGFHNNKCKLRKSTLADMDLLYKWVNDPLVRSNSFNSNQITYEDHVSWFNRIIADPTVLLFILMEDNLPIGQIRLNINGQEAEIGYSIAFEYRGKGYGHIILQLVKEEVEHNFPEITKLVAKVKPENIASNKLFEAEGYALSYVTYTQEIER